MDPRERNGLTLCEMDVDEAGYDESRELRIREGCQLVDILGILNVFRSSRR